MSAGRLPTTRWRLREGNSAIQDLLMRELGLSQIVSRILMSRDIADHDEARRYLSPSLRDLHNPFLMQDMKKAVERLIRAVGNQEKVVVYGDYDADGITSVVVLLRFLRLIHQRVDYYIPDRIREGYGLNREAVERLKSEGVGLIITVDCGISDHDSIAYARRLGMDTIILDHHELSDTLPEAVAIVNPHRPDCRFPFKHLAAVGIVFNFLIALRGVLRREGFWKDDTYPNLKEYLDLVALGTIGDIAPLSDENRIFAKIGLELITEGKRVGLNALKQVSGIEHQAIDSGRASFSLIPRINAAGRIASAREAVELLLTENRVEAEELAKKLDGFNRKRQAMEKVIFSEVLEQIGEQFEPGKIGPLVFASPRWHPGVIGIVASRLVDRFGRPAILISLKDGIGKGSGRSAADFNIYQGLKRCESLLLSYGGHRYAAGISIREEDIERFSSLLREVIQENAETDFTLCTTIDSHCSLTDINDELLSQFDRLAPFGSRNPEPVLCVRNVSVASPTVVGNNHLKMRVSSDGVSRNSIWFSKGEFLPDISTALLDIVFTPQINYWNGSADIQLKMRDAALPNAPSPFGGLSA
ncbi:MAG: single-stranded-DNA-specific exonuclease RecJ [Proteobacteria bacterium]|nr:single-stranded-DNA-specific exonuclease RecJ [Pseudomonadota bacterium]MBU2228389.1 single-stranded-DNA-specific exonuclease RecJ [Pseudomonadota bacterium]MBU2262044.1 single-stranded-DNA-specific exonuclease RecJ [Pseudomonadota bacterium]